jgi:phosphoenolpyruvate synthase/pyruvate phosphate dikinase
LFFIASEGLSNILRILKRIIDKGDNNFGQNNKKGGRNMKAESVQYDRFSERYALDAEKADRRVFDLTKYMSRKFMNGKAVSLGVAIGRAVVIKQIEDMKRVKNGTIIIFRNASPELVVIMAKASAIATEHGGQAAGALRFARAYGIPAVAGVPGITETIKDGDIIEVDGTNGTVELLKHRAQHLQRRK